MLRACRTSAEEGRGELGRMGAWRGEAVESDSVIRRGGAKVAEDADKTFKADIAALVAVVPAL